MPASTQSATAAPQGLIRLLTAGASVSVACIYLNHPLLGLIGHDLNIAPHALGILPTLTAAGYASGIFFFGPLGDRYDRRLVILWKAVLLMATTFTTMALFPHSLPAIVIGTLLFDVAVQAALVSHQTIIYALAPEARSRINAVFMTIMFVGMSAGAYGASLAWNAGRWTGLMAFCTAASSIGLGLRLVFNAPLGTR